ncbi:fungal specific transcription factor [Fusarium albosuccineum]|uniref:Fungal specific transcription factor n=1 Tax=Fusarium albosuccineum TaxID=1237068 RepID=A0A8H4L9B1_9HYPO|nr:fungal specific transcription factor [Fusarium albosuccineum]
MAASVQVIEKASHTCRRCRVRKQRCDRLLPGCTRCTSKLVKCDYSHLPTSSSDQSYSQQTNPLVEFGGCSWDLTSHDQTELIKSALDHSFDKGSITTIKLTAQFHRILSEIKLTLASLFSDYRQSIHRWFPIADLEGKLEISESPTESWLQPSTPLLWFSMLLVTTQHCGHADHLRRKRLYATLQSLCAVLRLRVDVDINLIQAQALIALYECSQAMPRQAHLTLRVAISMVDLMSFDTDELESSLHWRVSLIILDRMIVLSGVEANIPLLCPPSCRLSRSVQASLLSDAEKEPQSPLSVSHKLQTISDVVLMAGRVLHYVQSSKGGITPAESYCSIDEGIKSMVKTLLGREKIYSGSYCDPMTMILCFVLILHQERSSQLGCLSSSEEALALHTSRRMVWDTCRMSLESKKDAGVTQVSYVSMCCVLHSLSIIAKDTDLISDNKEVEKFLPILQRFNQRWAVGHTYLNTVRSALP